ncbi:unnamed protein product [Lupinus luteus]|uniref:Uncharacterized protein n=1 Tax=Lupinus luteus TaxID=3873 RepID=A0AAV1WAC4_LUPLU
MSDIYSKWCKGDILTTEEGPIRILQHPFHFCSLSCKVDHMLYEGENLCTILHRFNESDFSFSQFEGLRVDGSEVIYQDTHFAPANSSSFNTEVISNSVISCEESIAKNKKTNGFFLSHSSRRKD